MSCIGGLLDVCLLVSSRWDSHWLVNRLTTVAFRWVLGLGTRLRGLRFL
jgi:hypothetical protein